MSPFNIRVPRRLIGSISSRPHAKYQYPTRPIEWASTMPTTRVRWLSHCRTRQVEAPLARGDRPGAAWLACGAVLESYHENLVQIDLDLHRRATRPAPSRHSVLTRCAGRRLRATPPGNSGSGPRTSILRSVAYWKASLGKRGLVETKAGRSQC